jgi:carboxylesterase
MPIQPFGVIILHGFTASLDCVRKIEPPLTALGLPIRMPILRGHGAPSPAALNGVTWHDWLADSETALLGLLNDVEKVVLIGHSMGGLLALQLAAKYKTHLDSLVLAAAAVQMSSPFAPGQPLNFLAPLLAQVLKKWGFPPVYADASLAQFNTNYLWAPAEAVLSLLDLARLTRKMLPEVSTPALILQSRMDATVAPENVTILSQGISTLAEMKHVVWFEKSGHEMFRDCERSAIVEVIVQYVRERISVPKTTPSPQELVKP